MERATTYKMITPTGKLAHGQSQCLRNSHTLINQLLCVVKLFSCSQQVKHRYSVPLTKRYYIIASVRFILIWHFPTVIQSLKPRNLHAYWGSVTTISYDVTTKLLLFLWGHSTSVPRKAYNSERKSLILLFKETDTLLWFTWGPQMTSIQRFNQAVFVRILTAPNVTCRSRPPPTA